MKHLRPLLNYDRYLPAYYEKHKGSLSVKTILKDIQEESLFGMVEVDVKVPDDLYDYFSEMSPLFCTCLIPFDAMGKYTQKQIEELNLGKHPRKLCTWTTVCKSSTCIKSLNFLQSLALKNFTIK